MDCSKLDYVTQMTDPVTMKKILIAVAVWMVGTTTMAQEFKIAKSTGRLELNIGRVTVEGYNGNEIIFSSKDHREGKDERAQGLRAINSLGLEDNTGAPCTQADIGGIRISIITQHDTPASIDVSPGIEPLDVHLNRPAIPN